VQNFAFFYRFKNCSQLKLKTKLLLFLAILIVELFRCNLRCATFAVTAYGAAMCEKGYDVISLCTKNRILTTYRPLEESFLKKRLGRFYGSSQSALIGRVYLFLADKVVKAEYQLHTEDASSSMEASVSVSWYNNFSASLILYFCKFAADKSHLIVETKFEIVTCKHFAPIEMLYKFCYL